MKTCMRSCADLECNSLRIYRSEGMFRAEVVKKLKHTFCDQSYLLVRRVTFDTKKANASEL
jgi:hypothetical protein